MSNKTRLFFALAALGALLGLIYSGFSTSDFVAHLDRQLHPVNCTFLPGLTETAQVGREVEGCKTAMFSPYSSFWREKYWGGVPVSLFGMGLFAFALALALWGAASGRGHKLASSAMLLLSGVVAVGTSLVFFTISASKLHTFCTLCVGTYIGSGLLLLGAALAFFTARTDRRQAWGGLPAGDELGGGEVAQGSSRGGAALGLLVLLAEMGLAVFLPAVIYLAVLPDYTKYVTSCEALKAPEDKAGILLHIGPLGQSPAPAAAASANPAQPGAAAQPTVLGPGSALLVLDPLCPACKAFHKRMASSPRSANLDYSVLLLPLDSECNWMISDSLHPGACMLSRAMMCAGDRAPQMLDYFYEAQDSLRDLSNHKQLDRLKEQVVGRFPDVARCIDAPETKIKLNKALHYAVANTLPVLTPQLYFNGKRLCDEDTDLGLDFALVKLLGDK